MYQVYVYSVNDEALRRLRRKAYGLGVSVTLISLAFGVMIGVVRDLSERVKALEKAVK